MIGTRTVETSEYLRELLNKQAIKHKTLNARQNGTKLMLSRKQSNMAINMAGRRADIILQDKAFDLGGLHVIYH